MDMNNVMYASKAFMVRSESTPHIRISQSDHTVEAYCDGLRATSHTRPRARDHYTSSTLIGGKSRSGPSSLPTMLEGPTEYVNVRWM